MAWSRSTNNSAESEHKSNPLNILYCGTQKELQSGRKYLRYNRSQRPQQETENLWRGFFQNKAFQFKVKGVFIYIV